MVDSNDVMMKQLEILDKVIISDSKEVKKQVNNYKVGDISLNPDNNGVWLVCDGGHSDSKFIMDNFSGYKPCLIKSNGDNYSIKVS